MNNENKEYSDALLSLQEAFRRFYDDASGSKSSIRNLEVIESLKIRIRFSINELKRIKLEEEE